MSVHFEKLRIKQIKKETPDCVSIVFDIPEELQQHFSYKHGQHLTMRTFINDEEVRRSYSLCSSPLDKEWRVAVKKAEGGLFSSFANEKLKQGDILEVMPPLGHFYTEVDPSQKKSYVAFAAGSGITPVLSIIKTVLSTEPQSDFTLVYGNRNRSSIIFREELEALKNNYINRLSIIHVLSREMTDAEINYGRINTAKCKLLFDKKVIDMNADEFFICGPEEMIFTVKNFLEQHNVDEKKIHFELFTTPETKKPKQRFERIETTDKQKCKVTAKLDGVVFEFDVEYDGDSIIDAALFQGIELPYSCKGGVCSTCKAKLLEGEVEMDAHYSLEDEEIEQGYILACQSHPKTNKVVIDFDIK
jgi:ring-1,2-phenylacetyl-CoA epoxidase subunit PaaE